MKFASRRAAIALMCASASIIPLVDTLAKVLTDVASPFFLVAARYAIGAALAAIIFAAPRRAFRSFKAAPKLHSSRSALLVAAMVSFYWAISDLPVATALGGYFTGPVIAAVLSVLFLGEKLRITTIVAVLLGFAGAMLILRPEDDIALGSILALLSGVLSGFYLVLTRAAALSVRADDNVLIQSVIGALLIAPIAALNLPTVDLQTVGLLLLMGGLSFVAHGLFLAAFRTLDVGTLAPLAYLEIAIAALLGWMLFDDPPSIITWSGIVCVVIAGMLITFAPTFDQDPDSVEKLTRL
ncbi:DMT family transporter [Rhodobacteraceae bacterium]|nr:DMT family transporter [Paracoccaceae bacterium]